MNVLVIWNRIPVLIKEDTESIVKGVGLNLKSQRDLARPVLVLSRDDARVLQMPCYVTVQSTGSCYLVQQADDVEVGRDPMTEVDGFEETSKHNENVGSSTSSAHSTLVCNNMEFQLMDFLILSIFFIVFINMFTEHLTSWSSFVRDF